MAVIASIEGKKLTERWSYFQNEFVQRSLMLYEVFVSEGKFQSLMENSKCPPKPSSTIFLSVEKRTSLMLFSILEM